MSLPADIYVNWPVVKAMVGDDIHIPSSELPTTPYAYALETGYHLLPSSMSPYRLCTAGAIRIIERSRSMKREAEYKAAIATLENQQKTSNDAFSKLLVQYEQLLASYTAMKQAYEAETEVTRALKKQLDDTLEILKSAGIE